MYNVGTLIYFKYGHINDNFFQVSVKGLFFDKDNKLMMIQEDNGVWELPGGRVQKGEDLIESLRRECLEETGLECQVLDQRPSFVYSAIDKDGRARLMIFFKIEVNSLDFKPSNECVDIKFYNKEEIKQLKTIPQIEKLPEFL